jgi:beta-glucosidase
MSIVRKTRLLPVFMVLTSLVLGVTAPAQQQNDVERRIDALLARMTLEEKLGQLQQLDGHADGKYRPEHVELVRKGLLGSTLNVRGAEQTNELQKIAVEQSRLKIPLIFGFDVIHGYRTIFPVPLGEAASWDPAAVERSASVAALETRASGVHWTFAPMVDIARDARWGRIVEGSGEDPYLGSVMARARVRGFQGTDYSAADKIVATAKHFVAYGAAEAGRDYNTTDMSERVLREVYLPPFKAAVDAGVGTFMTSFNDLNGVPATGNPFLLTDVLRGEWKFDGFVVSDYTAVMELMNHRLAANEAEAAQHGLNAGTDMEMVSRFYNQHGPELLRQGKLSQKTIDEAVRRILRIKFRLGLFDKPYSDQARERAAVLNAANVAAAREVAARSMVLLKNERATLPLAKSVGSIAVIGPLADDPKAMLGSWAGDGKPADAVTLLSAIKQRIPAAKVVYAKGVAIDVPGATGNFDARPATTSNAGGTNVTSAADIEAARNATTPVGPNSIQEAVNAARSSDVTVLAVGETAEMTGEAASRTSLDLPGRQLELIQAIHATGKPYVVVLMNGRPLTINWLADNSPAILESWFAGTQAGNAIADVLFGDVNPGGKLPVTFPRTLGQVPIYYNHKSTGRPPTDQKYTSKYLDVPVTPLYPFGYGLSYTQFTIGQPELSATSIVANGQLTVSVEVENTGKVTGDEVVQLYVRDEASSVTRPVKELKSFQRVTLKAGEKRRLQFTLTPEHLGFYNREMRWIVEPGDFRVMVGPNSEDLREARFQVAAR